MDMLQGKHFSITDPKGVNTVIYQVNKTKKEFLDQYPKYTVERLDFTEEIKPRLYFNEVENKVKGKCKFKPYKSYFAFEVREDK